MCHVCQIKNKIYTLTITQKLNLHTFTSNKLLTLFFHTESTTNLLKLRQKKAQVFVIINERQFENVIALVILLCHPCALQCTEQRSCKFLKWCCCKADEFIIENIILL